MCLISCISCHASYIMYLMSCILYHVSLHTSHFMYLIHLYLHLIHLREEPSCQRRTILSERNHLAREETSCQRRTILLTATCPKLTVSYYGTLHTKDPLLFRFCTPRSVKGGMKSQSQNPSSVFWVNDTVIPNTSSRVIS